MAGGGGASLNGAPNGAAGRRPRAGAALHEWLGGVDWSVGTLNRYLDFLKENFDSPEQLSEIYSKLRPDGSRAFDFAQFFEDVGIEDPSHKCFFESWFAPASASSSERPAGAAPSRAAPNGVAAAEEQRPSPGGLGQLSGSGSAAASPSRGSRFRPPDRAAQPAASTPSSAATAASSRQGTPGRGLTVEDWMGNVDWSAGLLTKYRQQFEENFDDPTLYPNQIRDAYVASIDGRQVFDEASFFGDLGIEDVGHRELFRTWFSEQFGAVSGSVI